MRNTSLILLTLVTLFSAVQAQAQSAQERTFTRGYMLAVDTRDHAACAKVDRKLKLLVPDMETTMCAPLRDHPISVAVVSIPSNEWDFFTELTLAKGNKDILSRRPPGFAKVGTTGVMFFLPTSRDQDNFLRLTSKRSRMQVSVAYLPDLQLLENAPDNQLSLSFILENLPHHFSDRIERITARMKKRLLSKDSSTEEQDRSLLALLNLVLSSPNPHDDGDTSKTPGFRMKLFLPADECGTAGMCNAKEDDRGFFGANLLTGLGLILSYRF